MNKKRITAFAAAILMTAAMSAPITCSADEWVKTESGYKSEYTAGSYATKGWLQVDGKTY